MVNVWPRRSPCERLMYWPARGPDVILAALSRPATGAHVSPCGTSSFCACWLSTDLKVLPAALAGWTAAGADCCTAWAASELSMERIIASSRSTAKGLGQAAELPLVSAPGRSPLADHDVVEAQRRARDGGGAVAVAEADP